MNNFRLLLSGLMLASASAVMAQGAKNIRINEVLTNNTASIVDEFGNREAWIELENTSFTTYNIRGMYFTTDRSVLDPKMSVPERIKRMRVIPNGDPRTQIGGRQHLVFFGNSSPAKGKLHLSLPIPLSEPVWIGFYNGNAVELIDSVTVPALAADQSYARHGNAWSVKSAENACWPWVSCSSVWLCSSCSSGSSDSSCAILTLRRKWQRYSLSRPSRRR